MKLSREPGKEPRTCTRCLETRPLAAFYKLKSGRDGLQSWCKDCVQEYATAYGARNRERRLERARARGLAKFGMNQDDYDRLLEAQLGGCGICGARESVNGKRLCVDHRHQDGVVRGLLCDNCNRAIGLLQDSPELLSTAVKYLERV
jgi:hypothetical protein